MKFIKPLNEENLNEAHPLDKKTIKQNRVGDLKLELTEKFIYFQQDNGGNIVQQVVIEKEQAKELIDILQKFSA